MRRLLTALAALVLVFGFGLLPAAASGSDDDNSGSGSVSSGSDDDDDDDDRDDEDFDDDDDDRNDEDFDDDDRDDDDDDDEDGHHQRRHRRRHRGGDETGTTAGGSTGGSAPAPSDTGVVRVLDDAFSPGIINVTVGGSVTWNNVSREHTVTAADDSFDSGVIDAGQDFSHTFDAAGTFDYLCMIHTDMTGRVVVGGGGDGATGGSSAGASSSGASAAGRARSSTGAPSSGGSSGLPALGDASVKAPVTAAAATTTAEVDVSEFAFEPADVTITPGSTVRWTLVGDAPHTVTSEGFDSGMLQPGDSYEQTFNDVGTTDYICEFHPDMQGTVTVADAAAPPADTGSGSDAAGDGGEDPAGDTGAADDTGVETTSSGLANTGAGGLPALLGALAIILAGWAALVTGKRRASRARPRM
jgi:plastocyanin